MLLRHSSMRWVIGLKNAVEFYAKAIETASLPSEDIQRPTFQHFNYDGTQLNLA